MLLMKFYFILIFVRYILKNKQDYLPLVPFLKLITMSCVCVMCYDGKHLICDNACAALFGITVCTDLIPIEFLGNIIFRNLLVNLESV